MSLIYNSLVRRLHTHSQNFLRDPKLVRKLVGHSNLDVNDTVYDIGAGSGVISSVVADYVKEVVAIEYDERVLSTLRENTKTKKNVTVVHTDVMNYIFPTSEYKVFSNIPFHLSSPILRKLTESEQSPTAIYLIVQKQFAKKLLIGTSPFTGQLGAFIAPLYEVRIRYVLKRSDFWPHPAVDTVMIECLRRDTPLLAAIEIPGYREFVETCYSRQKYFAGLRMVRTTFPDKRPSQLTTDEWVGLYHSSKSK